MVVFSIPLVSFRSDKKGKINITIKSNAHKHIFAVRISVTMFFCAPETKVATKPIGRNTLINKRTLKTVFFICKYFIDRITLLTIKNTGTVKNITENKSSILSLMYSVFSTLKLKKFYCLDKNYQQYRLYVNKNLLSVGVIKVN